MGCFSFLKPYRLILESKIVKKNPRRSSTSGVFEIFWRVMFHAVFYISRGLKTGAEDFLAIRIIRSALWMIHNHRYNSGIVGDHSELRAIRRQTFIYHDHVHLPPACKKSKTMGRGKS